MTTYLYFSELIETTKEKTPTRDYKTINGFETLVNILFDNNKSKRLYIINQVF